jgi:hypothetical protein
MNSNSREDLCSRFLAGFVQPAYEHPYSQQTTPCLPAICVADPSASCRQWIIMQLPTAPLLENGKVDGVRSEARASACCHPRIHRSGALWRRRRKCNPCIEKLDRKSVIFTKAKKPVKAGFISFLKTAQSNLKFQKVEKIEKKNLKKLESISRFLVETEFKNSKQRVL